MEAPLSVGIDLVPVDEVREALDRFGESYLRRLFTAEELREAHADEFREAGADEFREAGAAGATALARLLAGKEAAIKALAPELDEPVPWQDIVIASRGPDAPSITLGGMAGRLARRRGIGKLELGLSHTRTLAGALVVGRERTESE